MHRLVIFYEPWNLPKMTTSCLITTPIFYVNSQPHLGHAFSMLVADAHARWKRKSDLTVNFSTGTDEHGQKVKYFFIVFHLSLSLYLFLKIWKAAQANGTNVKDWCDGVSHKFRNLASKLNISHSDFVRTTETRHIKLVQELWVQFLQLIKSFYLLLFIFKDEISKKWRYLQRNT